MTLSRSRNPLTGHAALMGLLSLALCGTNHAAAAPGKTLALQAHEQRPWSLPANLERIAIADPEVADVIMLRDKRQALLVGKTPGHTTLLLWLRGEATPERIQVDVHTAVQQGLLDQAGDNASLTLQDGQALLQGNTSSMIEHQHAYEAAAAAIGAKPAGGGAASTGHGSGSSNGNGGSPAGGAPGGGQVSDATTVDSGSVVQVDVKVVEFNKTVMNQIGLNLIKQNGGFSFGTFGPSSLNSVSNVPNSGSGSGNSTGGGNSTAVGGLTFDAKQPFSSAFNLVFNSASHNLFADLSLLTSNGMARVLAEPTLVALSGQSASFLAGGELPIPEPQGLGTVTIVYKPFGIGLTVTPTVLAPDRIALKVAPEASDLDYTNALTFNGATVPAITTRRADTTVELGDGESYIIGGLVSRSTTSTVNKVPLLGDLPIIGAFFRDLNYQRQDKELLIVVTPHLVQPLARGVDVPLPGQNEEHHQPIWGSWLLHPAGPDQLPGFSR